MGPQPAVRIVNSGQGAGCRDAAAAAAAGSAALRNSARVRFERVAPQQTVVASMDTRTSKRGGVRVRIWFYAPCKTGYI